MLKKTTRAELEGPEKKQQTQADAAFKLLMDRKSDPDLVMKELVSIVVAIQQLESGRVESKYSVRQLRDRLKAVAGYGPERKEPIMLGWVATFLLALRVWLQSDKRLDE